MVTECLAHLLAAHAEGSGRPDQTFCFVMLIMKAADGRQWHTLLTEPA